MYIKKFLGFKDKSDKIQKEEEITKTPLTKEEFENGYQRVDAMLLGGKVGDRNIKNIMFMSGLTPRMIQLIFGVSDFNIKGEYLVNIWGLEFKGTKFALVSAPKRGTTLESKTNDTKIVEEFINSLVNTISKNNDENIQNLVKFLKK